MRNHRLTNTTRLLILAASVTVAALLLIGCGAPAAALQASAPTNAPVVVTLAPTDTPVPPTATPVPPTNTAVPPTA